MCEVLPSLPPTPLSALHLLVGGERHPLWAVGEVLAAAPELAVALVDLVVLVWLWLWLYTRP